MQGMLTRTRLTLAGIATAAALTVGCSSGEGDASPPTSTPRSPATTSAPASDAGAGIAAEADAIATLIYQGCGEAPKVSCETSGQQVMQHAETIRDLMESTGRDAYYGQGIAIIDRLLSASESPDLRAAAMDLLEWLDFHPA